MPPLTLTTVQSPDQITPAILMGCSRLVPDSIPFFIERLPTVGAIVNKCTYNVQNYLSNYPGEMILGWEVSVWENVFLDCIGHAVIRFGDQWRCITPSKYGDTRLLFIPDSRLTFDFNDPMARMPVKKISLSSRPEVKRLIEVDLAEYEIKIKYPVSSSQIIIEGEDAIQMKRFAKEKNSLMLKILLTVNDHKSKCPCGSGKKFRKCHRADIEKMLLLA